MPEKRPMQKFTAQFKFPCNFQSNSPQRLAHDAATPESRPDLFGETRFCVIENRLFAKRPRHYTGVIHQRAAGGKWEEVKLRAGISISTYLDGVGAKPADFKGLPRLVRQ